MALVDYSKIVYTTIKLSYGTFTILHQEHHQTTWTGDVPNLTEEEDID